MERGVVERERVQYRHREQRKSNEAVSLVVGTEYTDYMHFTISPPELSCNQSVQCSATCNGLLHHKSLV